MIENFIGLETEAEEKANPFAVKINYQRMRRILLVCASLIVFVKGKL